MPQLSRHIKASSFAKADDPYSGHVISSAGYGYPLARCSRQVPCGKPDRPACFPAAFGPK